MNRYGDYVLTVVKPKTETEKAEFIKRSFETLIDRFVGRGFTADWNTLELIVKEGENVCKETRPPQWQMTVGIKFMGISESN